MDLSQYFFSIFPSFCAFVNYLWRVFVDWRNRWPWIYCDVTSVTNPLSASNARGERLLGLILSRKVDGVGPTLQKIFWIIYWICTFHFRLGQFKKVIKSKSKIDAIAALVVWVTKHLFFILSQTTENWSEVKWITVV